jgi:hypothetical protein
MSAAVTLTNNSTNQTSYVINLTGTVTGGPEIKNAGGVRLRTRPDRRSWSR